MMCVRGELHMIELDLAVADLNIWDWWRGGFAEFLVWCGCW